MKENHFITPPKKRHTSLYCLAAFCIFLAAILTLPSLLSTDVGKTYLSKRIGPMLKGSIEMQDLHLSWFRSQIITGLNYQSLDKNQSVQVEKVLIEDSLYSLLRYREAKKLTQLISPTIHTSLSAEPTSPPYLLALFMNHLFIQNGSINILDTSHNTLDFKNLDIRLELGDVSHVSVKGDTLFNQTKGTINLYTDLNDNYLVSRFFSKNTKTPNDFEYKGSIQLNHVPTFLIAELLPTQNITYDSLEKLLGPTFDLNSDFKLSDKNLGFDINASSKNLQISLSASTQNQILVLQKPAYIEWNISSSAIKALFKESELTLKEPSLLKINLNSLSIPYKESKLDIAHLAYQVSMNGSAGYIFHKESSPISIQGFSISSSTTNFSDKIAVAVKSTFQDSAKTPSNANVSFNIYPTAFLSEKAQAVLTDVKIDILKFPLLLVDKLVKKEFSTILGNTLTLKIDPIPNQPDTYSLNLWTPKCSIPNAIVAIDSAIHSKQSFLFSCDSKFLSSANTAYKSALSGTVENFYLSLNKFTEKYLNRFNCQLKMSPGTLAITSPMISNEFSFQDTLISINAKNFNNSTIKASTTISYNNKHSFFDIALDQPISMHFTASLNTQDLNNLEIPHFECLLRTDRVDTYTQGALTNNLKTLSFSTPISLRFLPSREFLEYLTNNDLYNSYNIYSPIHIALHLQPLQLDKNFFDYFVCEGDILLDRFDIINNHLHQEYSVRYVKGHVLADATKKTFSCNLNGEALITYDYKNSGLFALQCSSNSFSSFEALKKDLIAKASFTDFPSELIDTVLKCDTITASILGNQFSSDITLNQNNSCFINCELKSPNLSLKTDFEITGTALQGSKKALEASWTITPKTYASLKKSINTSSKNFELTEDAALHVKLDKLLISLSPESLPKKHQNFKQLLNTFNNQLNTASFDLTAKLNHLKLRSSIKNQVDSLDYLSIECLKAPNQPTAIMNIEAKANDFSKEAGQFTSTITFRPSKVVLTKPLLASQCHACLNQFPTTILDALFRLIGLNQVSPSILLGKKVDATLACSLENLSGTVDLEVNATNSKATINAYLSDGVLKLAQPIKASSIITPELASFFLNKMNVDLAMAKQPLTLFIDNQGFYLPLAPFDISQIRLRKAILDFGEILCKNLGSPQDIGSFFKLQPANSPISLWFTPLELGINQGVMSIDRTELLYDRAYQICFWGKINLMKQKVKMILGLTEQSLRKALGIQGLPRNFVLQIPMEGSFNNVKINKEIATARIAFLLAKSSGLTKQGGVFGNVIDLFGDMANDQSSTPPPKPPFPWQQALSQHEEEEKQKTTVNILK